MDQDDALAAFDALSQSTRLDVFRLLVRAGPAGLAAGTIAETLGIRQNTLSTHLRILATAGLLTSRRDGRHIYYGADFRTVRDLTLYLLEDCCGGEAQVCGPVAASLGRCGKN